MALTIQKQWVTFLEASGYTLQRTKATKHLVYASPNKGLHIFLGKAGSIRYSPTQYYTHSFPLHKGSGLYREFLAYRSTHLGGK